MNINFKAIDLTRLVIKLKSTAPAADARITGSFELSCKAFGSVVCSLVLAGPDYAGVIAPGSPMKGPVALLEVLPPAAVQEIAAPK